MISPSVCARDFWAQFLAVLTNVARGEMGASKNQRADWIREYAWTACRPSREMRETTSPRQANVYRFQPLGEACGGSGAAFSKNMMEFRPLTVRHCVGYCKPRFDVGMKVLGLRVQRRFEAVTKLNPER